MIYLDAVDEVLARAAEIKLPGHRVDVVTTARRELAKRSCCDFKFINPIEETLQACLQDWSIEKKLRIWQSIEAGTQSDLAFEEFAIESIHMDLESELLYYIIEELSSHEGRK